MVRAPDCGSGCRGFESLYPPHIEAEGPELLLRPMPFSSIWIQGCSQAARQGTLTPSSLVRVQPSLPRRWSKLHIPRFRLKPQVRSLRRSSFPNRTRHAGLRFGGAVRGGPPPLKPNPLDPVAQLAEHLPFKQGVRSSNLRWVTTSEQAAYRLLRLFSKVRARSLRCSSFPNRTRFAGLRFGLGSNLERKSILPTYCTSEQAAYRLLRLFQKSERAHCAAPPFQIEPAYPQGVRRICKIEAAKSTSRRTSNNEKNF